MCILLTFSQKNFFSYNIFLHGNKVVKSLNKKQLFNLHSAYIPLNFYFTIRIFSLSKITRVYFFFIYLLFCFLTNIFTRTTFWTVTLQKTGFILHKV